MFKNLFRKKVVIDPEKQLADWEKNGRPVPPPHIIKQRVVKEYKERFNINTLVETGTYLGEMVEAQLNNFSKIISIELKNEFYRRAKEKFRNNSTVELLQGDSGKKLAEVVPRLNEPALFWLDGHYSGGKTARGDKDCPVPEELDSILKSNYAHIILIDDARMFNGTGDYPDIPQIEGMIKSRNRSYQLEVKDDIIRLTPLQ